MSIYVIGDIQGCADDFRILLKRLSFKPDKDRLWLCGDLVNRGPDSLGVLRLVRAMGDSVVTVLGNHDLHLLAVAYTDQPLRSSDTLQSILQAPDREDLLQWLRCRPFLHHDPKLNCVLVHAGIPPNWDLELALACARSLEHALTSNEPNQILPELYGNKPALWHEHLTGFKRLRYIVNGLTRMRYCNPENGKLVLNQKQAPDSATHEYVPWFNVPWRRNRTTRILFGHWSTLGAVECDNVYGLDTGCVWGGALSARRIDEKTHAISECISVPCPPYCRIKGKE